jgi:serine/threonine protein phosphatase PrpC
MDQLIVVADGVGGWTLSGVDSGLMSRELTSNIIDLFLLDPRKPLKNILVEAAKKQTH